MALRVRAAGGVRRERRRRHRRGKSDGPGRGDDDVERAEPEVKEGDDADDEIADARRTTTSRRELERQPDFEEVSPEVGQLDEDAFDELMQEDPDRLLGMLADLTGATDQRLRELARRLAGRLFLDLSTRGPMRPRGVGRLATRPYRPDAGDVDLDASLDAIVTARASNSAPDPDELRVRTWATPETALCLVVDRSGSMGGEPLATAGVAAAAVAWRAPDDYSVLSFGNDVIAVKSQDIAKSSEMVVDGVLALRGFGTTDLAGALIAAQMQLARSTAARRIAVLFSDCRPTVDGDVFQAAAGLDELMVVAPDGDSVEAEEFAARVGAPITTTTGPSDAVAALSRVLDRT